MAIPKRGRRAIVVDGVEYHYLIVFERSDRMVIKRATNVGGCLFVFPFKMMKPSHVADAVRFGTSCGWIAEESGGDCWIVFDTDGNGQSHFEHLASDDFRVVSYATHGRIPPGMEPVQFPNTEHWYYRQSPARKAKS